MLSIVLRKQAGLSSRVVNDSEGLSMPAEVSMLANTIYGCTDPCTIVHGLLTTPITMSPPSCFKSSSTTTAAAMDPNAQQ